MPTKPKPSAAAAELRGSAEGRLEERRLETSPARTETDTQRLVHELQVHQIELEMQNEELQKARNEMEAEMEKYSDLYEFAPVGYVTLDREGTIREANLTSANLLGIERSKLLKRRFGLCVSAADRPAFTSFLTKVFASKAREFCEVKLLQCDQLPIEVRIEAAVSASGRECRAVLEDMTAHNRAEADRLILDKLESTGILAGGLAHDFNNLLTVILLDLELAQGLAPAGEELAHLLGEAKKAALTAGGLTQQIISFAKGSTLVCKPTRLAEVIHESVRPAVSGSRVWCEFSLADDLWLVEVDAGQIAQVIRNIVLNAKEAMPEGGAVSIRAENVALAAQDNPSLQPGDYVRLNIADRGTGIAKEVLPKIFDPYFSTKTRGNQKGMGLGLTICHTVIQRHGGAIVVESKLGVGTTFYIHLPASRKRLAVMKTAVTAGGLRHGRVLVMDDEEGVRKLVGLTLWGMGHEVELAADGEMAIEVFNKARSLGRHFDVVILELVVRGGMGGLETVRALLQIDPSVKAIVMSGQASDPAVLDPERHGFKGVVAKPFDKDKLQAVLSQVMLGSNPDNIVSP